jgi:hypothetical protein
MNTTYHAQSNASLGWPSRWLTLNNIFGRFAAGARVRNCFVGSQDVAIGGLKVARAIVVKKASRTATKKPGASDTTAGAFVLLGPCLVLGTAALFFFSRSY